MKKMLNHQMHSDDALCVLELSNGQTKGRSPAGGAKPGASSLSGVWKVFTTQPGLGVMLVRPNGCVDYVNESYIKDYIRLDFDKIVGRNIADLFTSSVALEIQAAVNRVSGDDVQLIRKVVFKGVEIQVTYRWLADENSDNGHVLITLQRGFREPDDGENVEIVQAGFIDLGPLSVLSDRELEVLALIGQEMRVKEIAATLCRSPKTVESHVGSISKKIGTNDRAVLMRIASKAGLTLEAARLPRVSAIRAIQD